MKTSGTRSLRSLTILIALLLEMFGMVMARIWADTCVASPPGLVGWWRAETNALDSSGSMTSGTLAGNTTYGSGRAGQGFVFDGNGDAILLGNPASLQLQDFTIEAWVKRASATVASDDGNPDHLCHLFGGGFGGYGFGMFDDGRLTFGWIGVGAVDMTTPAVSGTNWHHVAVTKSGDNVVFCVDGIAYGVPAYSAAFSFANPFAIGARAGDSYASFFGVMDEVAFYNRALTTNEIQAIYGAASAGKCIAPFINPQPTNQTAFVGDAVTLSVGVSGVYPVSFQWKFNATNIVGATNAPFTRDPVQLADAGGYSVSVSNASGSVTSSNAVLTVNPTPPCVAVTSNLVSWWRGEGNAADFAGTNNGILTGNTTYGSGRTGQGFVFDGIGDVITLGNPASLQSQNFTIEAWVKRGSATLVSANGNPDHVAHLFGGGFGGYALVLFDDGRLTLGWIGVGAVDTTTPAVSGTNWHHVAVTKSGDSVVFYVDGTAYGVPAFSATFSFENPFAIGARGGDSYASFFGMMDEIAFYNRALTTNEIQATFNARAAGKCIPPPAIINQPASQTAYVGDNVTFNVGTSWVQPSGYQWRLNGTNLNGANSASLTLTNVQLGQAANYSVTVSNEVNSVVSSNAVLTVLSPICSPVVSNLVSWWRGEGDALDFIGNNPGSLTNNATFGAGRAGQGFVFDGNGDAVRLGNPVSLQLQNFTIEGWIKRASATISTTTGSGNSAFLGYGNGGYGFGMYDDGHLFLTRVQVDNVQLITPKVDDTNWHHVAVTKSGTTVLFYIDGLAYSVPAYSTTYTFSTPIAIGARGDNLSVGFYGSIDELAVYSRALSTNEIQAIYNARGMGKCAVPIAPYLTSQPTNRTVIVGSNTTFSVTAAGSPPLRYQWSVNGTNLAGATNTSLTLTNVQFHQAGNYALVVSNTAGSVTSSNALLTVIYPPAVVRVVNASGLTRTTVAVPVQLVANGNENSLSFSLAYNTNLLTFTNAVRGSGAVGAALIPYTSQTNSGRIGVALALNSGSVFAPGTQEVVLVYFNLVATPAATNQTASVTFGDQPTARQLLDEATGNLAAFYTNGIVTVLASDWEGDTTPRTNGNKQLTITDSAQVGQFVARLAVPSDGSEYQRADCAPRSTVGNGVLSITDWVQAGRYAAGFDPLTVMGGPTTEDPNGLPPVGSGGGRTVRVVNRTVQAAATNTVTVQLDALGSENALGFSLSFNPAILQFVSATLGADMASATSNLNTSTLGSGKLGVALALSPGASLPAGPREILKVNFAVVPTATGTSIVAFASNPIAAEISDAAANSLPVTYTNGLLTVSPLLPVLRAALMGTNPLIAWPVAATNFVLQVNAGPIISSSNWNDAGVNPVVVGAEKVVIVTNAIGTEFFRLYKP